MNPSIKNRMKEREIIGRIPDTISRTIILFLCVIFIILLILGFSINYSDTISGKATVTSIKSGVNLVMPNTGKINLLAKQGEKVADGQIIAVINNAAKLDDILFIKKILEKNILLKDSSLLLLGKSLRESLVLGEVQVDYSKFLYTLEQYINTKESNIYVKNIQIKEDLFLTQKRNLVKIEINKKAVEETLNYSLQAYRRDSILFSRGIISASELEASKANYLQQKMSKNEYDIYYGNAINTISSIQNEIIQIKIQEESILREIRSKVIEYYTVLLTHIHQWEKLYVIETPIEGYVEYLQFWKENQYISINTDLFSIAPNEEMAEVEVYLPAQGIGKITKGQKTIIRIDDYPSQEYGYLEGVVSNVSDARITVKEQYLSLVKIKLINSNMTNYRVKINLKEGMAGTVEIITQRRKLIERLFDKVKYIFEKQ